jgi:hypothetical protein
MVPMGVVAGPQSVERKRKARSLGKVGGVRGYEYVEIGDSLKAIVLGVDCPPVYHPAIKEVASDIPIYHLRWDDQCEDFAYSRLESKGKWEARRFPVRD